MSKRKRRPDQEAYERYLRGLRAAEIAGADDATKKAVAHALAEMDALGAATDDEADSAWQVGMGDALGAIVTAMLDSGDGGDCGPELVALATGLLGGIRGHAADEATYHALAKALGGQLHNVKHRREVLALFPFPPAPF